MKPIGGRRPPGGGGLAAVLLAALLLAGCVTHLQNPPPQTTRLGNAPVIVPGEMYGNILVVETKWDRNGPYHFLIDTGSSLTLITPELARRYPVADPLPAWSTPARVGGLDGTSVLLPRTVLDRLDLGSVRFGNVPALVYDCSALSSQLGIKVDGVLGFALFRHVLLTLDYPRHRVILRPLADSAALPGSAVRFNNSDKIPQIAIGLGEHVTSALVDSGSNDTLGLNPAGHDLAFASGPTEGPTVGTLTGDRVESVGRLSQSLELGDYSVPRPVVELGNQIPAVGGGILRYFTVSFDQEHDRVIFSRDSNEPIAVPGLRHVGLSFSKTPVYWRVVGVIHGSPADAARIQPGDLVVRIDGEAVAKWDSRRYDQLQATAAQIAFTFLNGTQERTVALRVADLVP